MNSDSSTEQEYQKTVGDLVQEALSWHEGGPGDRVFEAWLKEVEATLNSRNATSPDGFTTSLQRLLDLNLDGLSIGTWEAWCEDAFELTAHCSV